MTMQDYVKVLRAHWMGVLGVLLLGILIAGGVTVLQPKEYTATTSGIVAPATGSSDTGMSLARHGDTGFAPEQRPAAEYMLTPEEFETMRSGTGPSFNSDQFADSSDIGHSHVCGDFIGQKLPTVTCEMDNGTAMMGLSYDAGFPGMVLLNDSAYQIWAAIDGSKTCLQIAADIAGGYGLPTKRIFADVCGVMEELRIKRLVEFV